MPNSKIAGNLASAPPLVPQFNAAQSASSSSSALPRIRETEKPVEIESKEYYSLLIVKDKIKRELKSCGDKERIDQLESELAKIDVDLKRLHGKQTMYNKEQKAILDKTTDELYEYYKAILYDEKGYDGDEEEAATDDSQELNEALLAIANMEKQQGAIKSMSYSSSFGK